MISLGRLQTLQILTNMNGYTGRKGKKKKVNLCVKKKQSNVYVRLTCDCRRCFQTEKFFKITYTDYENKLNYFV